MLKRTESNEGENEDDIKKVFLILDNLKVHHAKIVTEWVEKNKDRIGSAEWKIRRPQRE